MDIAGGSDAPGPADEFPHVNREAMQAVGRFAGRIAHDVNDILQVIEGATALLERRADDPDAVRRFAAVIEEASARGGAVTRRLLAFAHNEHGRGEHGAAPG